jgi:hypothetical protein
MAEVTYYVALPFITSDDRRRHHGSDTLLFGASLIWLAIVMTGCIYVLFML